MFNRFRGGLIEGRESGASADLDELGFSLLIHQDPEEGSSLPSHFPCVPGVFRFCHAGVPDPHKAVCSFVIAQEIDFFGSLGCLYGGFMGRVLAWSLGCYEIPNFGMGNRIFYFWLAFRMHSLNILGLCYHGKRLRIWQRFSSLGRFLFW